MIKGFPNGWKGLISVLYAVKMETPNIPVIVVAKMTNKDNSAIKEFILKHPQNYKLLKKYIKSMEQKRLNNSAGYMRIIKRIKGNNPPIRYIPKDGVLSGIGNKVSMDDLKNLPAEDILSFLQIRFNYSVDDLKNSLK